MGQRGPLPDNVHEIKGHRTKEELARRPKPRHVPAIPNPPSSVKGEALAEWKRVTPELHRMGYLARIDRATLTLYCRWWARWKALDDEMASVLVEGDKGRVKNPLWQPYRDATDRVVSLAKELALTPNARLRMPNLDGESDGTAGDLD